MSTSAPSPAPKPFVIWTLQRTGGTNLTQRLIALSGLPSTEHEPFNKRRIHGHVTQRWEDDGDLDAMNEAMATIAAGRRVIKHCVEMVPPEVSLALAKATSEAGYQHLFLYRRQALGRLLSLQFARVSGIWGSKMKDGREMPPEELSQHLLPVAQLVAHEQRSVAALTEVWDELLALGQSPSAIAYEDLYAAASPQAAQAVLAQLLVEMGVTVPAAKLPEVLADVLGRGDQGTRDAYDRFQGIAELADALAAVPGFVPVSPLVSCEAVSPEAPAPWVAKASLEGLRDQVLVPRRRMAEGLVVLAPGAPEDLRLLLQADGQEHPVAWRIRSKWAEKSFPDSPNAARARFSFPCSLADGTALLVLEHPGSGERQTVLELVTAAPKARQVVTGALALKKLKRQKDGVGGEAAGLATSLMRELGRVPQDQRDKRWREAQQVVQALAG
jgi:LPS sulfotransferase NodH